MSRIDVDALLSRTDTTPLRTISEFGPNFPRYDHAGKVRETFDLDNGTLLMVASDRISISDVVLPTSISDKGIVLTQMTDYWTEVIGDLMPTHIISTDLDDMPRPFRDQPRLSGRSMLVRKLEVPSVECVARGWLTGSGLRDYKKTGMVCGNRLPPGLVEASKLPEPIFTPATKESRPGMHDRNITFEEMVDIIGDRPLAERLRELTLLAYSEVVDYALKRGVIVADTKLEFGLGDQVYLVDEFFTPDSSRFWPLEGYVEGQVQPSFDKQYVRDYGDSQNWNKQEPGPELPEEVVQGTRSRYREAYKRLVRV